MGSLQDGDVHGEDVAVDGYIWKWQQAVDAQNPKPAAKEAAAPSGGTGMLQDGEVHGEDVGPEGYITKWYAADRSGGPK